MGCHQEHNKKQTNHLKGRAELARQPGVKNSEVYDEAESRIRVPGISVSRRIGKVKKKGKVLLLGVSNWREKERGFASNPYDNKVKEEGEESGPRRCL